MIVFHWTVRRELASILRTGLDPRFARSRVKYVWLADKERILELMLHIAQHNKVHPSELVLLEVNVPPLSVYSWARSGIYRSPNVIPPESIQQTDPGKLFTYRGSDNDNSGQ